jgi:hypothetical protein
MTNYVYMTFKTNYYCEYYYTVYTHMRIYNVTWKHTQIIYSKDV